MNEIKKFKDVVTQILTEIPETRDNDNLLMVHIWQKETQGLSLKDFFDNYSKGLLPVPDSVSRCRRKIQESISELRGNNWELRQTFTGQVKQELKSFMDKKDRSKVRNDIKKIVEKIEQPKTLDFSNAEQIKMF